MLIEKEIIQQAINFNNVKIDVFDFIDSTNEYLKTAYNFTSNCNYHICIAEYQSQGKGRLQRSWYSPFAKNIYLSIKYKSKRNITYLSGLSLVIALAVLDTLTILNISQNFKVKWPNDIYFKDSKIAGILTEVLEEDKDKHSIIIGIGLNVNMTNFPQNIENNCTSLKKITSRIFNRNKICILLINSLIKYIRDFEIAGFKRFITSWNKHDYLSGKNIAVKNHNSVIEGMYKGVDTIGNLVLESSNKKLFNISYGDATIIKKL